jgi:hypothetical protein
LSRRSRRAKNSSERNEPEVADHEGRTLAGVGRSARGGIRDFKLSVPRDRAAL